MLEFLSVFSIVLIPCVAGWTRGANVQKVMAPLEMEETEKLMRIANQLFAWRMTTEFSSTTTTEPPVISTFDSTVTAEEPSESGLQSVEIQAGHHQQPSKYSAIPVSEFCSTAPPGSYGNPNYGCQIYHVCQSGGQYDTLPCPEKLHFNDHLGICDWSANVDKWCNVPIDKRSSFQATSAELTAKTEDPAPTQREFRLDIRLHEMVENEIQRRNLVPIHTLAESRMKDRLLQAGHYMRQAMVPTYASQTYHVNQQHSPYPEYPVLVSYPVYLGYRRARKRLLF